ERAVALQEIRRIAGFRLADLIDEPLGSRIIAMSERLGRLSERPDALVCSYLTPAHLATGRLIRDWMLGAGLQVEVHAVGNVIGPWPAPVPGVGASGVGATGVGTAGFAGSAGARATTLLTGCHYDTVVDAGKFDGRLGVLLPIAVVAQLRSAGVRLPYTLTI